MVLTEFDEKKFIRHLKQESYAEGFDSGTKRINELNRILITTGRYNDLEKSASDPEYQKKLIQELLPEYVNKPYE